MKGLKYKMDKFFGYSEMLLDTGVAEKVEPFNNKEIYYYTGLNLPDLDFYLEEAKKVGGKVLELGCGYGRILLQLLKLGIDIDGLEKANYLVDRLLGNAEKWKLNANIYRYDMKNVSLINKKYDLVICPNYVMDYIKTYEEAKEVLYGIKHILNKEGKIIFNFDLKDDKETSYGPAISSIKKDISNDRVFTSIVETTVLSENLRNCNVATYIIGRSRTKVYVSATTEFRWEYLKLAEIIKEVGLSIEHVFSDYMRRNFVLGKDDECIMVLKEV